MRVVDLGHLAPAAQPRRIRQLARRQAARPFHFDRDRLLRLLLLRCSDHHSLLLLTTHHLIFDGWSRWLLIRELGEQYTAWRDGGSGLPALPIQYADYAIWSRQQRPRPESLAYWRGKLQNAPRLELPGDFPRPQLPSQRGAQASRRLSPGLVADLETLAGRERMTLYMLLLTGFKLVLSRWSGSADLTVGSPVANRVSRDFEQLLGCFIETLPIRTDLSGSPTCLELLKRVRNGVIDAFVHADVPFEKIVEQVNPSRQLGKHPLFDVMFNLVSVPQRTFDPEGLAFSFSEWTTPEARFDLSLYARKKAGGLELSLIYRKALFKADRMEQLLTAFESVLQQMVADPQQPVAGLTVALAQVAARVSSTGPSREERWITAADRVAPRNPDEETVAAVYRELLGRDDISVHDNFFALGGHSLLAAQALSRLRRQFLTNLPLRLLFTCQTVAGLATAIRQTLCEVDLATAGTTPVTLGQRRLLNFMADNPCSAHYNVSRKVLLRGGIDPDLLEQALAQVVARHDALSTGYRMEAEEIVPVCLAEMPVRLQRVDIRTESNPAAAAEELVAAEIARPFELDSGPLLRATLIRTADEEHILLVSAHHVSADCWSLGMPFGPFDHSARAWMAGVFFRQLWGNYRALLSGSPPAPLPLALQFGEVARRQNSWLAGNEAANQIIYWKQLLRDRPKALEVPPDLSRPTVWDFRGERLRLCIDRDTVKALRDLAREHGTTLFVVMQAAFIMLLHAETGATDMVTGTTAANRAGWDADDLVGFFSNNLLLRTSLAGDPDYDEVIRRCHDAAFSAFAHQELPFEHLLEELGVLPAVDRHPLFQIRFLLHKPADKPFVAEELCMLPVPIGREVAKYDLTLLLADDGVAIEGWLEYATSLYLRTTATKMLDRYSKILSAAVANRGLPLSAILRSSA